MDYPVSRELLVLVSDENEVDGAGWLDPTLAKIIAGGNIFFGMIHVRDSHPSIEIYLMLLWA